MAMFKRVSVVLALIVMLVLNTLAVVLPINNISTKALSDAIPSLFVPAGYVFSIWSLIYLALTGYAVYQALPLARNQQALQGISWLFVINALANAGWILLWHYQYVALSVVLMLVILVTLILIYLRLDIGRQRVSWSQYAFTHFPFSLYLGWISVATIANIAGALTVHHWNGFGIAPEIWSMLLLIIATVLTLAMLILRRDYVFAGVIVWAVIGIALNFPDIQIIVWTAYACVIVVCGASLAMTLKKSRSL